MLCGTVYYSLTLIIQETTLHVMWYSLLLTHFNHTGNNTACYVVQFIINSLYSYRKQHGILCGTVYY